MSAPDVVATLARRRDLDVSAGERVSSIPTGITAVTGQERWSARLAQRRMC